MKTNLGNKKYLIFLLIFILKPFLYSKILLKIEGDYLLYSYDYNYIYGKGNIKITTKSFLINGNQIDIDVGKRMAIISGDCYILFKNKKIRANFIKMNIDQLYINYFLIKDKIIRKEIDFKKKAKKTIDTSFYTKRFSELKKSLLYFVGNKIDIKDNYDVIGYKMTIYVEGLQSLSFIKFRMNRGIGSTDTVFTLNKIWYYKSIGLVTDFQINLKKKIKKSQFKTLNNLKLNYDIFKARTLGPRWEFFLNSINSLEFSKNNNINLNLNHITDNMTGVSLNYFSKISEIINTTLSIDYQKPFKVKEETWFRSNVNFNFKKFGKLNLKLNYEKQNQFRGDISYLNNSIKNISFHFFNSFSNLQSYSNLSDKRSTTRFSLSYSTKIFNLSTNYSLNRDLINNQSQANPRINLNFTPFSLYRGLLHFNILSSLSLNSLKKADIKDYSYQANAGMDITSEKLQLTRSAEINFSMRLEQFIDKDPNNNYTSTGIILRGKQNIFNFVTLELLYNYQARRRTESWFISGTTSQDLTTILKLKENQGIINMWTSLSYNSKMGKFTTGYLDFNIFLTKNWKIQTLLNYDFEFKKLNYDLYLMRKAGRITLRLTYRSLSKQWLFEILPG